jgi:hypothetical protein
MPPGPQIVIDQFGYLPEAPKIAVIRFPQQGFDAGTQRLPGNRYAVVNEGTAEQVALGAATEWNFGTTDQSSGDKVFWFDFSSVSKTGTYYVLDIKSGERSYGFKISSYVYKDVLRAALRTFYYQRAGLEKTAAHAGALWADGPSHIGAGQDRNARLFGAQANTSAERDLSGGWYDAGDYNRYTSWTVRYIVSLLKAFLESPAAFDDDSSIPESGNNVPDILDEVKWGLDWLVRMQDTDGSVLSILGSARGSPPSRAIGPSFYGKASTSSTLAAASAYALGSTVFRSTGSHDAFADNLLKRALLAYEWAERNPNVLFKNNDKDSGTLGLGAGQQEVDDYGRMNLLIQAATFLFEATGEAQYRAVVDANYSKLNLFKWNYPSPFEADEIETLLYYTRLRGASAEVVARIRKTFLEALQHRDVLGAISAERDPYRSFLKDFTWGSNSTKAALGNLFHFAETYKLGQQPMYDANATALRYLHYLHGVNAFGLVYLTNMGGVGAEHSVTDLYHSWYSGAEWRRRQPDSTSPPGFLVGGPNPGYNWDSCCPFSCGSARNNGICGSESLTPPKDQPPQKAYKDFSSDWPLNAWQVNENSNGYQVNYLRLLARFARN